MIGVYTLRRDRSADDFAAHSATKEYLHHPFGFVRSLFAGKDDLQACEALISGRHVVFVRGAAGSQLFYDMARQADAVADGDAECVQA